MNRALQDEMIRLTPGLDPLLRSSFLTGMDPDYFNLYSLEEAANHLQMTSRLGPDRLVEWNLLPAQDGTASLSITAYDYLGEFSILCGLISAFGLDILSGHIYTFKGPAEPGRDAEGKKRILDLFRLRPMKGVSFSEPLQELFGDLLKKTLSLLDQGKLLEARTQVQLRVVEFLEKTHSSFMGKVYPVKVSFDNRQSEKWTVLKIEARDTAAFLYAFSNALSLQGIYIHKVTIENFGRRVRDILYISNARGEKIIKKEAQEALKTSTVLTKQFTHFLAWSPDPGKSLRYFEQFLELILTKDTAAALIPLVNRKETLDLLARLLGTSEFLWEDFLRLRFENLFPLLKDFKKTPMTIPRETLGKNLAALLKKARSYEEKKKVLNDFKDREMFRIDLKHLRDRPEQFGRFSKALSDLADIVLEETGQTCYEELVKTYGRPLLEMGGVCPFSIFGLGKYGGREMGFASDIELIVVFGGEGESNGPNRIGNGEFFERLTRGILAFVTARREGIFHIDLRLRPYGEKGTLASPFDFIRSYYSPTGGAAPFERQALTKLRWVAGDRTLGKKVEQLRNRFVYSGEPWDLPTALELRGRQIRELIKPGAVNVKLSPGGVIDIEYAVQYLQLLHGNKYPDLRTPSTIKALEVLRKRKLVSDEDAGKLRKAYVFLRALIDALRMVRGNARDLLLPGEDSDDFKFLARRMGYFGAEWNREAAALKKKIGEEMEVAHRFFISRFGAY